MPDALPDTLKPRKRPVQARSEVTVAAIAEAGFQVLLDGGFRRLTTTRVADRAGVSVGTLYQYYPNKRALLAALIALHLDRVAGAVTAACETHRGASLAVLLEEVVAAFLHAKLRRPDVAQALYAPMAEAGGADQVRAAGARVTAALAAALAACPDRPGADPARAAGTLVTVLSALVQAALEGGRPIDRPALQAEMNALALGYLRTVAGRSIPGPAARRAAEATHPAPAVRRSDP